ncbi:MAG: bifunctional phosphopantothenoylcysteine decarboxylase/phosphopantothenate--cysteine ligase CoaBC [Gammaproteobacteria bacterium]|jgi:phosphopantothenoylcysteine decarboxylase/phosphopantothenate--cysteine ligase
MNTVTFPSILIGITGAIAAYKIPELVRRLRENGLDVRVMMTENAKQFVTPITLQAVSGNPVYGDLWDRELDNAMRHIELARFAQKILIAPASANIIAKLAQGYADDLLTTVCLATSAQIYIAPSMNRLMWENPATQDNIAVLKKRGMMIIPPACGEQACGEYGDGRMPEVDELVKIFTSANVLAEKKILLTAGPTIEAIDPVRFISNHSSGKMGYALAIAAKNLGASVTLISGPVHIPAPVGVNTIYVESAQQMQAAVLDNIKHQDIFIATAAVADYMPFEKNIEKIKKHDDHLKLNLIRTPDILATVAKLPERPLIVGFAAETNDMIKHAKQKLTDKNIDMICVNDVSKPSQGFHSDENAVTIITKNKQIELPLAPKKILATQIMQHITEYMNEKNPA